MNVVAAALAQPKTEPPAPDAKRVTVILSNGEAITGKLSPAAIPTGDVGVGGIAKPAPSADPICLTIVQGAQLTNVWINPEFIVAAIYDPNGDDKIVPAHLRVARG